jgi:transposase, IS5 family
MLVLQALHGLSLDQTEYLVGDRLSWMRFCGLGSGDAVPDANTLWDFREALIQAKALDGLFARLDRAISEAGYLPMSGQIVDATLVAAPRQRNTDEEKAAIKAGRRADEIWPGAPARAAQKDTNARWTVKFSKAKPTMHGKPQVDIAIPTFGDKAHISIDRRHGVIRRRIVTDAPAHNGARKSAIRSRVEHPFAVLKGTMRLAIRTIGKCRAEAAITLAVMGYNMKRWCWLDRTNAFA